MHDKVNITTADAEMAMPVHDRTESEAHTQLHKSCVFLSIAVLVLS